MTDDNNNEIIINNSKVNNYPYVIKETLATIDYTNATVVGILVATANSGNQIMPSLSLEPLTASLRLMLTSTLLT